MSITDNNIVDINDLNFGNVFSNYSNNMETDSYNINSISMDFTDEHSNSMICDTDYYGTSSTSMSFNNMVYGSSIMNSINGISISPYRDSGGTTPTSEHPTDMVNGSSNISPSAPYGDGGDTDSSSSSDKIFGNPSVIFNIEIPRNELISTREINKNKNKNKDSNKKDNSNNKSDYIDDLIKMRIDNKDTHFRNKFSKLGPVLMIPYKNGCHLNINRYIDFKCEKFPEKEYIITMYILETTMNIDKVKFNNNNEIENKDDYKGKCEVKIYQLCKEGDKFVAKNLKSREERKVEEKVEENEIDSKRKKRKLNSGEEEKNEEEKKKKEKMGYKYLYYSIILEIKKKNISGNKQENKVLYIGSKFFVNRSMKHILQRSKNSDKARKDAETNVIKKLQNDNSMEFIYHLDALFEEEKTEFKENLTYPLDGYEIDNLNIQEPTVEDVFKILEVFKSKETQNTERKQKGLEKGKQMKHNKAPNSSASGKKRKLEVRDSNISNKNTGSFGTSSSGINSTCTVNSTPNMNINHESIISPTCGFEYTGSIGTNTSGINFTSTASTPNMNFNLTNFINPTYGCGYTFSFGTNSSGINFTSTTSTLNMNFNLTNFINPTYGCGYTGSYGTNSSGINSTVTANSRPNMNSINSNILTRHINENNDSSGTRTISSISMSSNDIRNDLFYTNSINTSTSSQPKLIGSLYILINKYELSNNNNSYKFGNVCLMNDKWNLYSIKGIYLGSIYDKSNFIFMKNYFFLDEINSVYYIKDIHQNIIGHIITEENGQISIMFYEESIPLKDLALYL